jgi:hypothetical protein
MLNWKVEIRGRLKSLQLGPTCEAAIVEELAQYLEDHYAESLTGGATEAEAYQRTLAELSGSELLVRSCGAWSGKSRKNPSCSEPIGGQI